MNDRGRRERKFERFLNLQNWGLVKTDITKPQEMTVIGTFTYDFEKGTETYVPNEQSKTIKQPE